MFSFFFWLVIGFYVFISSCVFHIKSEWISTWFEQPCRRIERTAVTNRNFGLMFVCRCLNPGETLSLILIINCQLTKHIFSMEITPKTIVYEEIYLRASYVFRMQCECLLLLQFLLLLLWLLMMLGHGTLSVSSPKHVISIKLFFVASLFLHFILIFRFLWCVVFFAIVFATCISDPIASSVRLFSAHLHFHSHSHSGKCISIAHAVEFH